MSSIVIVAFAISFFFFFACQTGGKQLSTHPEKDAKLENTPTIKIITTKYGDIFDCVDIYKQPSLDHPLLQNHTVQMKPSFIVEAMSPHGSAQEANYSQFELEDGGCPDGFVPIKRIRKEELRRSREYFKNNPSSPLIPDSAAKPGWHHDGVFANNTGEKTKGVQGFINVYNPKVSNGQHSDSLVSIKIGESGTRNLIKAGWTVFPAIHGDTRTRLHTMWTADNFATTGCIDMHCPGFVQVSKSFSLGAIIWPMSTYEGAQYDLPIVISHDYFSGNWWLITAESYDMVGYWPKEIFTGPVNHVDAAGWGGRVYSPVGSSTAAPQMGSGHKSGEGYGRSCFVQRMGFRISDGGVYEDVKEDMLVSQVDSPSCYDLKLSVNPHKGTHIFFGGPGGSQCGRV